MKRQKRLTEAEWEIMDGIWRLDGDRVIAREVHGHLYPQGEKAFTTVQTVMNILVKKGYLRKEKFGKINFYTPTVSREEVGRQETHSLVSRLYSGSFGALVSHLVGDGSFSRRELDAIKAQIEAKAREQRR